MQRAKWLTIITAFALGCVVTFTLSSFLDDDKNLDDLEPELRMGANDFINPLLNCPSHPRGRGPKQSQLEIGLLSIIKKSKAENKAETVSVYFRDLSNGPIIGIGIDEVFVGASLLKVPLLVGYLGRIAQNAELKNKILTYEPQKHDLEIRTQTIIPKQPMVAGQGYSVDELLRRMIVYSDNRAANMLIDFFADVDILKILNEMGVRVMLKDGDAWLTAKDYSSIFRILYNSTYLDRSQSNFALKLLTEVQFRDGIVAGVPSNIPVAHKFGERRLDGSKYFHDCGIVYYQPRPYMLCVMTTGADMNNLIAVTAELSKAVFNDVSSHQ